MVDYTDLVIGGISLAIGILSAWIHMKISVASLKLEINHLKEQVVQEKTQNEKSFVSLNDKIDKIITTLTEIKVDLARKHD